MKRLSLLAFPLVIAIVCISSAVAHAMPDSVPCSPDYNYCLSDVQWAQNIYGAEVATWAKQGNLPSDSEANWELYVASSTGAYTEAGLFVTNAVGDKLSDVCTGTNTHGTVYASVGFPGSGGVYYCTELAPSLVSNNTVIYIQIGRYVSNGGGYAALFCKVECSTASGSQVVLRETCSYSTCGGSSTYGGNWLFDASFFDDGSSYNNNSLTSMIVTNTFRYENTSSVWQYEETGTSVVDGAQNPVQWYWFNNDYPSPSNPGGDLNWCIETVGQSSCS